MNDIVHVNPSDIIPAHDYQVVVADDTDWTNPALIYIKSLANKSRRVQYSALMAIADIIGYETPFDYRWDQLTIPQVVAVRSYVADKYDIATAKRIISALRQVIWHCWNLGQIGEEQRARLSNIKKIGGSKEPKGRALTKEEIDRLFTACMSGDRPIDIRDAALIAVLRFGGLRRHEVAQLPISAYKRGKLRITGKGRKTRVTPLNKYVRMLLDQWLLIRQQHPGELVFCAVHKNESLFGDGLSDQAIYAIVKKRAKEAGIETFTPHDMRRTFAGDLLDNGIDISAVRILMGHSNVSTTVNYDRRGERAAEAAVDAIPLPTILSSNE